MPHIHISDQLYELLEEGAEREGSETVDAYAERLLTVVVKEDDNLIGDTEESVYHSADETKIKDRLRDLGYIE